MYSGAEPSLIFTCDFEDGDEVNPCGMTLKTEDSDESWTVHQGDTNTQTSGPSVDHTLQSDEGTHYMLSAILGRQVLNNQSAIYLLTQFRNNDKWSFSRNHCKPQ